MPIMNRRQLSSSFGYLRPLLPCLPFLCLLLAINLACTPKQSPTANQSAESKEYATRPAKEPTASSLADGEKPYAIEYSTHSLDVGIDFKYQNGEAAWIAAMIESNEIKKVQYLQVQFHNFVNNSVDQRVSIRTQLVNTHTEMWNYAFVWESWKRK